jgi:hypothetical protein
MKREETCHKTSGEGTKLISLRSAQLPSTVLSEGKRSIIVIVIQTSSSVIIPKLISEDAYWTNLMPQKSYRRIDFMRLKELQGWSELTNVHHNLNFCRSFCSGRMLPKYCLQVIENAGFVLSLRIACISTYLFMS